LCGAICEHKFILAAVLESISPLQVIPPSSSYGGMLARLNAALFLHRGEAMLRSAVTSAKLGGFDSIAMPIL